MSNKNNYEVGQFDPNKDKAWYAICSFSGHDFRVAEDLNARLKTDFSEYFDEALIITSTEDVVRTTPTGKEKIVKKVTNLFPGYIYARLVMTDEVWYVIRNTKSVSGIIGSHGKGAKPTPIRDEDMNRLLKLINRKDLMVNTEVVFYVGDTVMIETGPFAGHVGIVDMFEKTKSVVRLTIEKFNNASIVVETSNVKRIGSLNGVSLG